MDELEAFANLGSLEDTRAMQYFEQLKKSSNGWRFCVDAFTSRIFQSNDQVEFLCLQVIVHYIEKHYAQERMQSHEAIRAFIMSALKNAGDIPHRDKALYRNKLSQIAVLVFVVDYPSTWPTFFNDILSNVTSQAAMHIYVRILMDIHNEIVDRDIVHTAEETQRNTQIKDTMREQSVVQLTESLYQIMMLYETSCPTIVCDALEVLGLYVSWIDINLVANEKFVSILLRFMSSDSLRGSACDCIHEIISKGMDPVAKTKLIESFMTVLESAGVMNLSEDEDDDFKCKLANLVNGMGINLLAAWQKLVKMKDQVNAAITLQAMENKVPYMLCFLGDNDDDVSVNVTEFSDDYISMLKVTPQLSLKQKETMKNLLYIIVKKMKYDGSYSFELEAEAEGNFLEYRKELKIIFNNLAHVDGQLVLETVHEIVERTLPKWKELDFRDVEVAITLLYYIGEAVPASHGQHFSGNPVKASALQAMMRLLITSGVSYQGHMAVQVQFFETVVRYDKFFICEPHHIGEVLTAFFDERGLRHKSAKVRSRTAYLFSRFVKTLKGQVQCYLEDILKRMQDFLVLNTPDNGLNHFLSDEDQYFMYEVTGMLIVTSSTAPEKKQLMMRDLLAPIATKFEGLLEKLYQETDKKRQEAFAQCIHSAMSLASRASKGFSGHQTMKACGCVEVYTELLKIFLQALNSPVQRQLLHGGVKQYLHRMVVCLENELLPFIPVIMENLLKHPEVKDLMDFIPLMNQLVMKFKEEIVPFLSSVLMPLVQTIYKVLSIPTHELDRVALEEKKALQRAYYLFISTLVNNQMVDALKAQDASDLDQILTTVVEGAVHMPDPPSQKLCFSILKKLTEIWGGSDGIVEYVEFIYKRIIPACFLAPAKASFDLTDGQTALALGECALCLKAIYDKRGQEMLSFLLLNHLPNLNVSPELSQEFCQALQADQKVFKSYLKTFFMKAKS